MNPVDSATVTGKQGLMPPDWSPRNGLGGDIPEADFWPASLRVNPGHYFRVARDTGGIFQSESLNSPETDFLARLGGFNIRSRGTVPI